MLQATGFCFSEITLPPANFGDGGNGWMGPGSAAEVISGQKFFSHSLEKEEGVRLRMKLRDPFMLGN